MTLPSSPFDESSIGKLRLQTHYEAWLLEAVYKITDWSLEIEDLSEMIYRPQGGDIKHIVYGHANIYLGDWRPEFLKAGAPLVFVTTFKLFDMTLEWVLTENGKPTAFHFAQKIRWLKETELQFPFLISARPWLKERIIALYDQLEPLRGTIIHDRHFTSKDGILEVSSSKRGVIGQPVTLTSADLRNIALLMVSIVRFLDGTWAFDALQEKRARRILDEIAFLHGLPLLGQKPPTLINVRIYRLEEDQTVVDLDKIRSDIATRRPDEDVLFNLRVITIGQDGSRAEAYLIPWDIIQETGANFSMTKEMRPRFVSQLPEDIDLVELARVL